MYHELITILFLTNMCHSLVNLIERHVDCPIQCPICEDDMHAFFDFPVACDCWNASGLSSVHHCRGLQFIPAGS